MPFTDQLGTSNPVDSVVLGQGLSLRTSFLPGDVLEYSGAHYTQVGHWTGDGYFLGYIDLHGYTVGVDLVEVFAMTQHRRSVYICATDQGALPWTFKIQEYGSDGNWVRDVVDFIDASDPAQNPLGVSQNELTVESFWLDSVGNIYGTTFAYQAAYVYKWDRDGVFLEVLDTTATTGAGGVLFVNPLDDGELFLQTDAGGTAPIHLIDAETGTITSTVSAPDTGSGGRTDVADSGRFFNAVSAAPPYIRKYEAGFGSFTDLSYSLPTGVTSALHVRVGSDEDMVWISGRDSAAFNNWYLWKHRLSTDTVLVDPIPISFGADAGLVIFEHLVYRLVPNRERVWIAHIGW